MGVPVLRAFAYPSIGANARIAMSKNDEVKAE
jgi:hypothetical protein